MTQQEQILKEFWNRMSLSPTIPMPGSIGMNFINECVLLALESQKQQILDVVEKELKPIDKKWLKKVIDTDPDSINMLRSERYYYNQGVQKAVNVIKNYEIQNPKRISSNCDRGSRV